MSTYASIIELAVYGFWVIGVILVVSAVIALWGNR